MSECQFTVVIKLKHRKIGNIAKLKAVFINKIKPVCKLCSDLARKIIYMLRCVANKEKGVISFKIKDIAKLFLLFGRQEFINGAFIRAVFKHFNVAKALHSDFKSELKHFFKPALRLLCTARNIYAPYGPALKCLKFNIGKEIG